MIGSVLRDGWVKFPLEKGSMFEYPWLMNYDQGCHLVRVSGWKFPLASTVVWHAPPPPTTLIGNKTKTDRTQLHSCSIPHRNFFYLAEFITK